MATCKVCFHCAACDMIYESCTGKNVSDLEFPNDAELCKYFKTRTKYVEVVHAEWLDGFSVRNGEVIYKSIDCSHCEEVLKIESETREYWKARFKVCPFCGAVMDGGNDR